MSALPASGNCEVTEPRARLHSGCAQGRGRSGWAVNGRPLPLPQRGWGVPFCPDRAPPRGAGAKMASAAAAALSDSRMFQFLDGSHSPMFKIFPTKSSRGLGVSHTKNVFGFCREGLT